MYVRKIEVKNLKMLEHFIWELPEDVAAPGWHVWLGDNGSGKSTLVRACAATLIGPRDAMALRQPWGGWVRQDKERATVRLELTWDNEWDRWASVDDICTLEVEALAHEGEMVEKKDLGAYAERVHLDINRCLEEKIIPLEIQIDKINRSFFESQGLFPPPFNHAWGYWKGWFAAAYGPFRRFSGGGQEYRELFKNQSRISRFLSAFGDDVALTEVEHWLMHLRFAQLERKSLFMSGHTKPPPVLLDNLIHFINHPGFLPNRVQLKEVNSNGIQFIDSNGCQIDMNDLSDGFRSILSMTFELIRQLAATYREDRLFNEDNTQILAPGVVFIDEVDAHLHPRWQRDIGPWLTKLFPNIQFFVTTHSPLVCQGAVKGSVWRLPDPVGEGGHPGGQVKGEALNRLLYGNILEAYGSGAFGPGINRSEEGHQLLMEFAKLNQRSFRGQLSPEEEVRRQELNGIFSATLPEDD
ncbi:MAG: ATP-binding protein [Magnetococcales bacterium]|nr:ATP-binding protein [Magnetococcales bacterium]